MTRKDYELIAKAIRATRIRTAETEIENPARSTQQLRGVRRTAAHLADAFAAENPRFDTTRFLKACGYGA